jgi:hypothetical protein
MCRESDSDLYWVAMKMRRNPEFTQLLRVKSMIRYGPPKYTAGLARSFVSGYSRSPTPPARMMTSVSSGMGRMIPRRTRPSRSPQLAENQWFDRV